MPAPGDTPTAPPVDVPGSAAAGTASDGVAAADPGPAAAADGTVAELAVIGRGLIGAAAARHLAAAGHGVALIGPDEPLDRAAHPGPFASHHDEGRITRALEADPFWSRVSRAAIARYPEIAAASGIDFFTEAGAVIAGPADGPQMRAVAATAEAEALQADRLEGVGLLMRLRALRFPEGTLAFHERRGAGHISPRRLVAAQTEAARRAGARIVAAPVRRLSEDATGVTVETDTGSLRAGRALVAAGAWSGALLPGLPPLAVFARTVALFVLDRVEAARLASLPALVVYGPDGRDCYVLPPIRYPDGRVLLKIGGDPVDRRLTSAAEIDAWFRTAGDTEVGTHLATRLGTLIPDFRPEGMETAPCVTTFTARASPLIARLSDRIAVATAGCGRGAKCSDELGRLGARALLGGPEPELAGLGP